MAKFLKSTSGAVTVASIISLIVSLVVLVAKFYAFSKTNSQAIFSDAMESIVNVVAASLAAMVIRVSSKPADSDHPYGHGKIEYFSAAFEGGLIAFASVLVLVAAIRQITAGEAPEQLALGMWVTAITGLANLLLGIYLKWVGRRHHSMALEASGSHVISDFVTSAGVFVGLFLVQWSKLVWIDPIVAMLMGLGLGWTGYRLVRRSVGGLMDEEDRELISRLLKIIDSERDSGLIQIHHCRVLRAGKYHHIDAHAVLPEFWDINQAHGHIAQFENRMMQKYPFDGELHLHVDPCRRAYCEICDAECPIRAKSFIKKKALTLEEFVSPEEPEIYRKGEDSH